MNIDKWRERIISLPNIKLNNCLRRDLKLEKKF